MSYICTGWPVGCILNADGNRTVPVHLSRSRWLEVDDSSTSILFPQDLWVALSVRPERAHPGVEVAKTLKEALLEQLDILKERGLAPEVVPMDDEPGPPVLDRQYGFDGAEEPEPRHQSPRRARSKPRRVERRPEMAMERQEESRPQRRASRPRARTAEPPSLVPAPAETATAVLEAPAPSRSDRKVAERLRRRAEARKRERAQREEVRQALAQVRGGEVDEQTLDRFLADLAVETGALPPMPVVVHAVRAAASENPSAVAGAVRAYYRTPRRLRTSA